VSFSETEARNTAAIDAVPGQRANVTDA
jgi:hypothetical protein